MSWQINKLCIKKKLHVCVYVCVLVWSIRWGVVLRSKAFMRLRQKVFTESHQIWYTHTHIHTHTCTQPLSVGSFQSPLDSQLLRNDLGEVFYWLVWTWMELRRDEVLTSAPARSVAVLSLMSHSSFHTHSTIQAREADTRLPLVSLHWK